MSRRGRLRNRNKSSSRGIGGSARPVQSQGQGRVGGGRPQQQQPQGRFYQRFPPLRLIFVRHGQTSYNQNRVMQGSIDVPLNGRGRAQARAVAKRLAGEKIDLMYASPMRRARETAEEITRLHPGLPIEFIPAIVEQSFGSFEGKPIAVWHEWRKTRPDPGLIHERSHGGEAWDDVDARIAPFASKLLAIKGKTVVIVSHGGVSRVVISRILGIPLEHSRSLFMDNAAICEVVVAHDFTKLASFNDTRHLKDIF